MYQLRLKISDVLRRNFTNYSSALRISVGFFFLIVVEQALWQRNMKEFTHASASFLAEYPLATSKELSQRLIKAEALKLLDRVNTSEVWMERDEILLVLQYLKGAKNYLEWGSGGSTLNFPQLVEGRVVSIEHSNAWFKEMPARLARKKLRHVELHCNPVHHREHSDGTYKKFRKYVDEILKLEQDIWDFVFIDGRSRSAAAIRALGFVDDNSIVVLHDFERVNMIGQGTYKTVLTYYDVVDRIGESVKHGSSTRGIGILRRKPRFKHLQGNHVAIQRILDKYSQIHLI